MLKNKLKESRLYSKLSFSIFVSLNLSAVIGIFLLYFKYCSDVEIRSEMKNILIECRDSLAIPNAVTGSIQKGSRNNNIVIEQLNSEISALKSKAKSDELRYRLLYDEKIEELNKDVTFWVCVLAAICTIVPIVLNIASIYNMNRDFEYLKNKINVEYEDLKEEYSQLGAKIRTFESSLSNAQRKLENNYEYFKIQTTLHSIKEMRDFDWQKHHLKSERCILFYLLDKIKGNNDSFVILCDNFSIEEMQMYAVTYFQMLKALIYKYETFFDKSPDVLSELLDMKYFLIDAAEFCYKADNKEDLKMKISILGSFINNLVNLFKRNIE